MKQLLLLLAMLALAACEHDDDPVISQADIPVKLIGCEVRTQHKGSTRIFAKVVNPIDYQTYYFLAATLPWNGTYTLKPFDPDARVFVHVVARRTNDGTQYATQSLEGRACV